MAAKIETLKKRAVFLAEIRAYFAKAGVMEVQTPTLAPYTVTDPHTESFEVPSGGQLDKPVYFLQTSPEYAIKALLTQGIGDVYQLGPAYRCEPVGRWHQPEFTMLEWYRVGWDDRQLMDEFAELLRVLSFEKPAQRVSYQSIFLQHTGLDPLIVDKDDCCDYLRDQPGHLSDAVFALDLTDLVQYIFTSYVETQFDPSVPSFVYDFPASQAALARLSPDNPNVARRFELYVGGLECANGFYELADPDEQLARFEADQRQRLKRGLPMREIDPKFMEALRLGLPDCAGVAVGVDRLFAALVGASSLAEVLP